MNNMIVRTQIPEECRRWTSEEDDRLRAAVSGQWPVQFQVVATCLEHRSADAIAARLQRLGLVQDVDMTSYRRSRYRRYRGRDNGSPIRCWTRWSSAEDAALLAAVDSAAAFSTLCARLPNRSEAAISLRLRTLGLAHRFAAERKRASQRAVQPSRPRPARRQRLCLTCDQSFRSAGPHNRLCDACRERIADISPYAF